MSRIVTQSAFARECGVAPSSVAKALSGQLGEALVGRRIDADHSAALEYASRAGRAGRPGGGREGDLADFIVACARRLRRFPPSRLTRTVSDNLVYLGLDGRWMRPGDRARRIDFVRQALERLEGGGFYL